MAEYESYPLWRDEPDGVRNLDPETIGVPQHLVDRLNKWAADFDATFDPSDPLSSGFSNPNDEHSFYARGLELAREIASALGPLVSIRFFDGRDLQLKDVSTVGH